MKPGDVVACSSCGAEGRVWSSSPASWREGEPLIVTFCNGPYPRHMSEREAPEQCPWCGERAAGFPSLQGRPLPSEAPWTAGGPKCTFEIPVIGQHAQEESHAAGPGKPAAQLPGPGPAVDAPVEAGAGPARAVRVKHKRPRAVPHRVRDLTAETNARRERRFGVEDANRRGPADWPQLRARLGTNPRGQKRIGAKSLGEPRRPAFCFLYEDLADLEQLETPAQVFGMYPSSLIPKILPWLKCDRRRVVHVCSGGLPRGEGIRVDIRPDAQPDVLADGRALPFRDGSVDALLIDPPYTEHYARDLYGVKYPRPAHLLREAARVVKPCGRIGFVHYITPTPPHFHAWSRCSGSPPDSGSPCAR